MSVTGIRLDEAQTLAAAPAPSYLSRATEAVKSAFNSAVKAASNAVTTSGSTVKGLGTRAVSVVSAQSTATKLGLAGVALAGAAYVTNKYCPAFQRLVEKLPSLPTISK